MLKETREVIILLYYTENVTLKQTLIRACRTAQRLASSVRELTGTLQSHPFLLKDSFRRDRPHMYIKFAHVAILLSVVATITKIVRLKTEMAARG